MSGGNTINIIGGCVCKHHLWHGRQPCGLEERGGNIRRNVENGSSGGINQHLGSNGNQLAAVASWRNRPGGVANTHAIARISNDINVAVSF